MTDLQIALQSPEEMASYLDLKKDADIIADIKQYGNPDRTVIATAAMQGLVSCYGNSIERAKQAVELADQLISELKKK